MTEREGSNPTLQVVLLAAGRAARFGSPKQLAAINGRPMLARAIELASGVAGRTAVTVVLGAYADRLTSIASDAGVRAVVNPDYALGLGSSIRRGMESLPAATSGVMLLLADQVAVTAEDLRRLADAWRAQPGRIAAAEYAGTLGVPAIFPADLFGHLAALAGDRGAREIIAAHRPRVVEVPMPTAGLDVDTPADLAAIHPALKVPRQ